jgi:hypothetical protein
MGAEWNKHSGSLCVLSERQNGRSHFSASSKGEKNILGPVETTPRAVLKQNVVFREPDGQRDTI